jgi:hypothetical protein
MEIDIDKYLSEDEKREIAVAEWREACRSAVERQSVDALISNLGYRVAHDLVAEALGATANEQIKDKALEVINGLTSYTVFHEPSIYNLKASPAWETLQNAVRDNSDLLSARIKHMIENMDEYHALEVLKSWQISIGHPA